MVRPYNLLICSVLWGFSAALREASTTGADALKSARYRDRKLAQSRRGKNKLLKIKGAGPEARHFVNPSAKSAPEGVYDPPARLSKERRRRDMSSTPCRTQ